MRALCRTAAAVAIATAVAMPALGARPATPRERANILPTNYSKAKRCWPAAAVNVSTVARGWALLSSTPEAAANPPLGCPVGNGWRLIYRFPNGKWWRVTDGGEEAPCWLTGVRVARDLLPGAPCARQPPPF